MRSSAWAGKGARRLWQSLGVVGAALVLSLAFGAAPASATKTLQSTCGSPGKAGGQFEVSARGVAVSQSGAGGVAAGTLYVADFEFNSSHSRIQSFDPSCGFIRAWGKDVVQSGKPNDTGAGFEICDTTAGNVAADCQAGSGGTGAGEFSANTAGGIAVDQASGDVYLVDRNNFRVQVFDASGHFIRMWGKNVVASGKPNDAGEGFEVCDTTAGNLAADCKAGEPGSGAGMLIGAGVPGIGVDGAGNVYVADGGNRRVQKFSSTGAFLAMAGWDVDAANPSSEYEVCTVAADCKAGSAGSGAGQFAAGKPDFLAVAGSGDLYAVGQASTIYHLSAALAFDPGFSPTVSLGTANHPLAINPADGHLFAFSSKPLVHELDPATGALLHTHPDDGSLRFGLALRASSGRMYDVQAAGLGIFEDGPTLAVPAIEAASGIGATQASVNGTAYPNGAPLLECAFEYLTGAERQENVANGEDPFSGAGVQACTGPGAAEIPAAPGPFAVHADLSGLLVNTPYLYRLRLANANGQLKSQEGGFTTTRTVFTDPATEIGPTGATLHGHVNPAGTAVSECLFAYVEEAEYQPAKPDPYAEGETIPCAESEAEIGSGTVSVPVHADLSGLEVGTGYHFRLLAGHGGGEPEPGEDRSFKTLGPSIEASWSQDVGFEEARLGAEINPNGVATIYRFEYGTQGPCEANPCTSVPVPDGSVGEDEEAHEVGVPLEGLVPGTTYHYRVLAENADSLNEGPDRAFTTYRHAAPPDPCPANAAFRLGPSAALPDCRAYEMVSPLDKGGGDIKTAGAIEGPEAAFRQAALDGERVTYTSNTAFGDSLRSTVSNQYLSTRHPPGDPQQGWSTHSLLPPQGTTVFDPGSSLQYDLNTNFEAFTPDLCFAIMRDHNLAPLDPEAIAGFTNLYLRDNCGPGADSYRALTIGAAPPATGGEGPASIQPDGRNYSADLSQVFFTAVAALESTPAAAAGVTGQIYDHSGGELYLVSVLPGGSANPGVSWVGSGGGPAPRREATLARAVSEDGSRVYWSSEAGPAKTIYLRENPDQPESAAKDGAGDCLPEAGMACTRRVSGTGDAIFWTASSDGALAVFSEGGTLYEYDAQSGAKTPIASGLGGVVGASDDLSHLYFTSSEALAAGAKEGELSLYLRSEGTISFIATAEGGVQLDAKAPIFHASRVSADGRYLIFMSRAPLSGYDNTDLESDEAAAEVYRYDAEAEELLCVSCKPSGGRPEGQDLGSPYTPSISTNQPAAAWLPTCEWPNACKRTLSADGDRVLFDAFDALVPEDTNGAQDVYQWEAPGTGSCDQADPRYFAQNGGCIELISTGKNGEGSELLDASAEGRDVFFTTSSSIDPRDLGFIDIYDARAGGGFPPPPPPKPPCVGDACTPIPARPERNTPAGMLFEGPGDPTAKGAGRRRCPKGKRRVRRAGKVHCVRRKRGPKQGRRGSR